MLQSTWDCSIFLKALVVLNLKHAIIDKVLATDYRKESFVVSFKYEKLGQLCFHCGKFDYIVDNCVLGVSTTLSDYFPLCCLHFLLVKEVN